MEAISLFEPKLLQLIKGNKELLCKDSLDDRNKSVLETFKKDVLEISRNYELLTYLFPVLQNHKLGYYSDSQNYPLIKINEKLEKKTTLLVFKNHMIFIW